MNKENRKIIGEIKGNLIPVICSDCRECFNITENQLESGRCPICASHKCPEGKLIRQDNNVSAKT